MFVAALRILAERCAFKDALNDALTDGLVYGSRNNAAQKK